jgi:hypothetical protein
VWIERGTKWPASLLKLAAVEICESASDAPARRLDAIYYIDVAGESTDVTAIERTVDELLTRLDCTAHSEPPERVIAYEPDWSSSRQRAGAAHVVNVASHALCGFHHHQRVCHRLDTQDEQV